MRPEGHWRLEGVGNFRDFGGWPTRDGGKVRTGRLFRSGHFAEATASDLTRLDAIGVRLVVDLRHERERETWPSLWPGAAGPTLLTRDPAPPAAAISPEPAAPFSAAVARATMLATYARIPTDPPTVALFGGMLRDLAGHGGPLVVHCMAGKDRTGIACALTLAALGVGRDAIFADYEATNAAVDPVERRRLVRKTLAEEVDRALTDDDIEPLIWVDTRYLEAALASIDDAGGMDAYLERALGLSRETRRQLKMRMVE